MECYLFTSFSHQRSILGPLNNKKLNRESYNDKGNENIVKQTEKYDSCFLFPCEAKYCLYIFSLV